MYRSYWRLLIKDYHGTWKLISIVAVTIVTSVLEAVNIGLLIPLLEALSSSDQSGGGHWISSGFASGYNYLGIPYNLGSMLIALGLLIFMIGGLKYLRLIITERTRQSIILWLRTRSMRNLLNADLAYFHKERIGVITDSLTNQVPRAGSSLTFSTEIIANAAMVIVYLSTAFLIAPFLAAIAVGTICFIVLLMQWHIVRSRSLGITAVTRENLHQATAIENISGIHVVKSFLLEQYKVLTYRNAAKEVGDAQYNIAKNESQMSVLQELCLFGLVGLIVYCGVSIFNLGIAVLITLLFIFYRLGPRVTGLNSRRQQLVVSLSALSRALSILEEQAEPTIVNGNRDFEHLNSLIELKGVSFGYGGAESVLHNVSFKIPKGSMTAIVGSSGSGKTTLTDLIMRLYDPTEGSIFVDDIDLKKLRLADWRKSIGVVSQDVFLFNDTIFNNIALGKQHVSKEDVARAVNQAYAANFIENLPQRYETTVGDRGWNLSGGQRQRLALARAIVHRPQILILDEATSSLDSNSEQLVYQCIKQLRGETTVIIVAHRLATIRDADHIVVLEDGQVSQEGQWDHLIKEQGLLTTFSQLQSFS